MLNFIEQNLNGRRTPGAGKPNVANGSWHALPTEKDKFIIISLLLQDLIHARQGKTNYYGYEKPKFGTLEEKTNVYMCTWVYMTDSGVEKVRPLVGNYNGGFQFHREAVAMCNDVWNARDRWRTQIIRPGR